MVIVAGSRRRAGNQGRRREIQAEREIEQEKPLRKLIGHQICRDIPCLASFRFSKNKPGMKEECKRGREGVRGSQTEKGREREYPLHCSTSYPSCAVYPYFTSFVSLYTRKEGVETRTSQTEKKEEIEKIL